MVDYVAVLRRTIDALPKNSPEIRERVYTKARTTVQSKLAMINPAPSQALIDKQMNGLEQAIATVETDFTVAYETSVNAPETQGIAPTQDHDPLMDVLRGMPDVPKAPAVFASQFDQRVEAAPVESQFDNLPYEQPIPDYAPADVEPTYFEPTYVEPTYVEPASRMPQASDLQFDNAPGQNQAFDDVFSQENAKTPLPPFSMPSLDDPVMLPQFPRAPRKKARSGRMLMPLLGLGLLVGVGFVGWTQRAAIIALLEPKPAPTVAEKAANADGAATQPATETPAQSTDGSTINPAENTLQKFTQRLNADGTEKDEGAGNGTGEQSVAELEPASPDSPATTAGEPAAVATPEAQAPAVETPATETPVTGPEPIGVGQKAIFYEERTSGSEGSARAGDVVWSIVRESPGNDRPPEEAVRGELSVPELGLNVRLTLRRNADATLPASHILELIMTVPEDFAGGTIEDVQRVNLKPTEESAGAPLTATPVKVADKYFLVALENSPGAIEANLQLLREQSWIDLPVVYRSGRRALFTMEKGLVGDQVFKQVLDAWVAKPLQ